MKSHYRVAVIGGGVIGCSILYHLVKLGWKDVVLLERSELTSGSTWHAAAGTHLLHDVTNIAKLHKYTNKVYQELEAETGQSCGIHAVGGIYLATTQEREYQLQIQRSKAKYTGIDFEIISKEETLAMNPLLDLTDVRICMFEPNECHVDPSGITHAFAKGARDGGAEIYRHTPVVETNPQADGSWEVVTPKGTIKADAVVNAAGLWGREVGKLAGVDLPLMTMEHQYFVTETIPEIETLGKEIPLLHDSDKGYYLRQEGKGLLCGAYEEDGRFWAVDGTPLEFGHELLPDDLDRISDNVMRACERIPVLGTAGVKRVINGPMIWTPDVAALLGPVPELDNYFVCGGVIPGFSQGAGLARSIAEWVVNGEPDFDLFALDMARFGPWASKGYVMSRALDNYSTRYRIIYPNEERAAGRPLRTRPIYEQQKAQGAIFGAAYGWEHPLWYAPEGMPREDHLSFGRARWFEPVGEECKAIRENLGMIDISTFAKYEVEGPGAEAWLDGLLANRLPQKIGRAVLAPMLSPRGGVIGDFTVTRLAADRFYILGGGAAERYHWRWFRKHMPETGVKFTSLSAPWAGFNIAGPKARDFLAALTGADVSNEAFRFLSCRELDIGMHRVRALRVSFTGELGYELYFPQESQRGVYQAILEKGAEFGLKLAGMRALASLRIEKGYGSWSREYSPEYNTFESRLERFVKLDKGEFIGRDAVLRLSNTPPREVMSFFEIDAPLADALGGEPILIDGEVVGRVSSGAYGYHLGKSLAIGYVAGERALPGAGYTIEILGDARPAILLEQPAYDPLGERLRG